MNIVDLRSKPINILYKVLNGYIKEYEKMLEIEKNDLVKIGANINKSQLMTVIAIMNEKGEYDIEVDNKQYYIENNELVIKEKVG